MNGNGLVGALLDVEEYDQTDSFKVVKTKSGRIVLRPNIDDYVQGDGEIPTLDFDEDLFLKRRKRLKHKTLEKLNVNNAFEKLIINNHRNKLLGMMKALG